MEVQVMKKTILKVTVALGIVLGGLIPFSYIPGNHSVAFACGDKDNSSGSTKDSGPESR